jgi:hypothetical protein
MYKKYFLILRLRKHVHQQQGSNVTKPNYAVVNGMWRSFATLPVVLWPSRTAVSLEERKVEREWLSLAYRS